MSSGIWANLPQTVKLYENETKAQIMVSGLHSNNILIIRNSFDSFFIVKPNQRLYQIVFVNCVNCKLWVLDSAVVVTQRTVIIDCSNCQFLFEDVDIRKIELHRTINSEVVLIDSLPLIEYTNVYCLDSCKNISFTLGSIIPGMVFGMNYKTIKTVQVPDDRPSVINVDGLKGINIHKYPRKGQPIDLLSKEIHLEKVKEWENTKISLSPDDLSDAYDAERKEYEEEDKEIERKTEEVAKILKEKGNHVVCYTGAGISTSADIPDYRGPQGMWTLKEKGQYSSKSLEFDEVWPTYAHYAITLLAKRGIIHHIISTNLDGLHLRTGLPAHMITEQHGNIYKEVCYRCRTPYYRQYDTHEGYQDHKTDRYCDFCNYGLYDTIVNFAENLHEADQMTSLWHSRKSTVALVMGTSMNVQPAASYPLQALKNNGKLVIVNLQKTPFDDSSHVRIFTKTDKFMKVLLSKLGIDSKIDQSFDAKASW